MPYILLFLGLVLGAVYPWLLPLWAALPLSFLTGLGLGYVAFNWD